MPAPLIVTLALDAQSAHFFTEQRQRYFPPERNFLQAHLTLFHNLPHEAFVLAMLQQTAAAQTPFALPVTSVVSTGRGVAYKIESPPLMQLHKSLQKSFNTWLIPQDRATLWPHVTIQNKVSAAAVEQLLHTLQPQFVPFEAQAVGIAVWEYLGGPWKAVETFLFAA